jgi:hypothetical protein
MALSPDGSRDYARPQAERTKRRPEPREANEMTTKTARRERCYCLHLLRDHYAGDRGCQFTRSWRERLPEPVTAAELANAEIPGFTFDPETGDYSPEDRCTAAVPGEYAETCTRPAGHDGSHVNGRSRWQTYTGPRCESGWTGDRCTLPLFHSGSHSNESRS